jgi:asparagine synthase (glutamine-hydrolysing)
VHRLISGRHTVAGRLLPKRGTRFLRRTGFRRRLSRSSIQAFTLTFDQAAYDEGDTAREMATRAGANFHPVPIKQSDIADNFADAIWHSETLCANGHGVSKYLLSQAVRESGYKVVRTV